MGRPRRHWFAIKDFFDGPWVQPCEFLSFDPRQARFADFACDFRSFLQNASLPRLFCLICRHSARRVNVQCCIMHTTYCSACIYATAEHVKCLQLAHILSLNVPAKLHFTLGALHMAEQDQTHRRVDRNGQGSDISRIDLADRLHEQSKNVDSQNATSPDGSEPLYSEENGLRRDPKEKKVDNTGLDLERERIKSHIARVGLPILFIGIIATALYGHFAGVPAAFALTTGFGIAASRIIAYYFGGGSNES